LPPNYIQANTSKQMRHYIKHKTIGGGVHYYPMFSDNEHHTILNIPYIKHNHLYA